ncbi:putative universal stress protein [Chaetomidium leptoderma]|uniref:Universal stress protein n=1 Tax=Chaetomidium leptoderma TaxID=669021 RepID=A0AAN6VJT3_9PEZI|nr:putative universal stress protein [Chaetomidium leptoderma]
MAKTANNVSRLTSSSPAAKSPDSDVSPGTKVPAVPADYFSTADGANGHSKPNRASPPFVAGSTDASTSTLTSISEECHLECQLGNPRQSSNDSSRPSVGHRKSSTASVTFRPPRNPSLPQGNPRNTTNRRLRDASPSPVR